MTQRPNILILSADGMRYDALRTNGNQLAQSPRLDALADQGLRCDRAYCTQPICMPCRASIMTGRYPSAHGAWQNGVTMQEPQTLMTTLLGQSGYRTMCSGKAHFKPWLPSLQPDEDAHQPEYLGDGPYFGFDRVRLVDHSSQDRYYDWIAEHFPEHLELARNPALDRPDEAKIAWKSTLPEQATKSRYIADHAIDMLRDAAEHDDQPFLLWASFLDPHHPYNPSPPFGEMFDQVEFPRPPSNEGPDQSLPRHYHDWVDRLAEHWGYTDTAQQRYQEIRRRYQGKVAQVDYEIGRVLDALDQRADSDNTIVVYLSDHGAMLGDYGLMQVGEYSQEPLIHTPMIWRGPGIEPKSQTRGLISMADVMPTLLDYAGLDVPLGVQGQSLGPLFNGQRTADDWRQGVLVENRWGQNPPDGFRTWVTSRYKLSICTNDDEGELYDLHEDPYELNNLYNQPQAAQIQARLTRQMLRASLRHEDPLPQRLACW